MIKCLNEWISTVDNYSPNILINWLVYIYLHMNKRLISILRELYKITLSNLVKKKIAI